MGRQLYIDADVLVYASAFAAQKTIYCYGQQEWTDAEQAQAWCDENEHDYRQLRKDDAITTRVEVLPESAARMILAQKLASIQEVCQSTDYLLLLSGDGNFRDDVAVTRGYKANRADTQKPIHYAFIRSCILDNKRAELTVGVEADDALGMYLTDNPEGVICSIDKDLNQIPGRHYNWDKSIKYKVNPEQALYYFHKQLLTGDITDNIPGIPGFGDKKAAKLLDSTITMPRAGWNIVLEEYNKGPFKFKGGACTNDDLLSYLEEQMQLLWILRKPGERVNPEYYFRGYIQEDA